jgi:hypothetical protein
MYVEHVARYLEKLSSEQGFAYELGAPASDIAIAEAEDRLGVKFPTQVVSFYGMYNGLRVDEPYTEVLPIERMDYLAPNQLHFATIGTSHMVWFDTSHINVAGQWDIVTTDGYTITYTMASFWSNKLWPWIKKRRAIWEPQPDEIARRTG